MALATEELIAGEKGEVGCVAAERQICKKFMRYHGALLVNLVNITEHFGPEVTGRA